LTCLLLLSAADTRRQQGFDAFDLAVQRLARVGIAQKYASFEKRGTMIELTNSYK
jgi:hypothetical protein